MDEIYFGKKLKAWRSSNLIKQAALAADLGVSQAAISHWERGLDTPSARHMAALRSKMARSDWVELERLFIAKQVGVRALFDMDGVKLIGHSQGMQNLWPDFCTLQGVNFEERLIGPICAIADAATMSEIRHGELLMVSGVSAQHVDMQVDAPYKNRWHISFKPYGSRMIADMVYELCDQAEPEGLESMCRADELVL